MHQRNTVVCSLSGYGQSGPRAGWPGQDLLIQAMSGILSTTGWEDGPPVAVGTHIADVTGALTAVNAVMLALYARAQYGLGQEIEVSLLDAMVAMQPMEATVFLNSGTLPGKSRSGHWMAPQPYGVFRTQDQELALNTHSDAWWPRLCRAPEFAHLATDPRFTTRQAQAQHGDALMAALEEILRTKTRDASPAFPNDLLRGPRTGKFLPPQRHASSAACPGRAFAPRRAAIDCGVRPLAGTASGSGEAKMPFEILILRERAGVRTPPVDFFRFDASVSWPFSF